MCCRICGSEYICVYNNNTKYKCNVCGYDGKLSYPEQPIADAVESMSSLLHQTSRVAGIWDVPEQEVTLGDL